MVEAYNRWGRYFFLREGKDHTKVETNVYYIKINVYLCKPKTTEEYASKLYKI